jgi:hypothetical protein
MKKFTKTAPLSRLPDEEHNKFMSDLLWLINNTNDAIRTAIYKILPEFTNLTTEENNIIQTTYENKLSDMLAKIDKLRDGLCRAIQAIVTAYMNSPLGEESSIAEKLKIILDKFDNIYQLPAAEKTTMIYNLLHELEFHAESYRQLHMENFLKDLLTATNMYEGLYKGHTSAHADMCIITTIKDVRLKIDAIYAQIIAAVEAAMLVDGISPYSNFVITLNTLIDHSRRKINSNKKKAVKEETNKRKPSRQK